MLLYHYSKSLYPLIKSKTAQGLNDKNEYEKQLEWSKQVNGIGPYNDSISFFMEPIPNDIMPEIYGKDHFAWGQGNELYEYAVDLNSIKKETPYEIVETTVGDKLLDKYEFDFELESEKQRYLKLWYEESRKVGYVGNNLNQFKSVASEFIGKLRQTMIDKKLELKGVKQYAPGIPHLMIYTGKIPVRYIKAEKIVMGKSRDVNKKLTFNNLTYPIPGSLRW